uniref:snRNA-activating protein complex subunit 3 n=1 Tax=Anthurium amnicola TaxID=1678845 RepID=A0A1D1ZJH7_9ARAE
MERTEEHSGVGRVPFARGGPLYVPDVVGPVASVLEFKASIVQELQGLLAELSTAGDFDNELSVDELKVFTEEELVEKALEALEETNNGGNSSLVLSDNSVSMEDDFSTMSDRQIVPVTSSSTGGTGLNSIENHGKDHSKENGQHISKKRKKRGRLFDRDTRASELDSVSFQKVLSYAEIKRNQDEDKAAARLHSFHGSSKPADGTSSTSGKNGRLRSLRFITSSLKVKSSNICQHMPLRYPEVVLCVEVYDNRLPGMKTQELLVLGTQRLTALRDNIHCPTNQLMQAAGQHDPSGYFLIEDLFLNDLRDPLAIDLSKPILEWLDKCRKEAKEKWEWIVSGEIKKHRRLLGNLTSTDLPQFKAIDMHKTRFSDLRFRLGSGYLYCHQGDCKHLIVIRDMRLVHPDDDQNETAYPIVTFQLRTRRRKCCVCNIKLSVMMTVDDKWAAKNPCYFCKDCYYLLHYKEDNSLLYDNFSVYDLESLWPMSRCIDKVQHLIPTPDL